MDAVMAEPPQPVADADLFLDGRGSMLRAQWDAERRVVVLSIWRDGRCVATHTLDGDDAVRLSALLVGSSVGSAEGAAG
jgi:hypothetical protein